MLVKGQFCSNCGIGCCLEANCLRKANLTHKCKEVAAVGFDTEIRDSIQTPKEETVQNGKLKKHAICFSGCIKILIQTMQTI